MEIPFCFDQTVTGNEKQQWWILLLCSENGVLVISAGLSLMVITHCIHTMHELKNHRTWVISTNIAWHLYFILNTNTKLQWAWLLLTNLEFKAVIHNNDLTHFMFKSEWVHQPEETGDRFTNWGCYLCLSFSFLVFQNYSRTHSYNQWILRRHHPFLFLTNMLALHSCCYC